MKKSNWNASIINKMIRNEGIDKTVVFIKKKLHDEYNDIKDRDLDDFSQEIIIFSTCDKDKAGIKYQKSLSRYIESLYSKYNKEEDVNYDDLDLSLVYTINIVDGVYKQEVHELLIEALDKRLTCRESIVFKDYMSEKTLTDIGKSFGVNRERIRQILHKSIMKIRRFFKEKGYIPY